MTVPLCTVVVSKLLWRPSVSATRAGVPPGIRRLVAVGAPIMVGQILFAAAFIINPNLTRWVARPWMPMRSDHSCASAYWVACEAVRTTPDIYAEAIYAFPQANQAVVRAPRPIDPLLLDQYEYPPPFLAPLRLMAAVTSDFWYFRRL